MAVPHLLAVGGAHVDRRGKIEGVYRPATSNPGSMREEIGGGAFNALRVAIGQGVGGTLMSVRGGDAAGVQVADEAARWGIADRSVTFLDRRTPSYTAILDENGDLVAGLADMSLYDLAFARQFRRRAFRDAAEVADAVLCDANLPEAGIRHVLSAGRPVFAIAISSAKVVRFAGFLDRLSALFLNRREAVELTGVAHDASAIEVVAALHSLGLVRGVVSAGSEPATVFEGRAVWLVEPAPVGVVEDVTGAGDALAGGTIAALMQGASLPEAAMRGMAVASLTVESGHSVLRTTADAIQQRLRDMAPPLRLELES